MKQKRKDSALKLGDMVVCNPNRFWSLVKPSTTERSGPNILRNGQKIVADPVSRANLMNSFSHSVIPGPQKLSLPPNYRVLERCVFNHCFPHISQFLYHL